MEICRLLPLWERVINLLPYFTLTCRGSGGLMVPKCSGFRPRFPLDQKFCFESPEIAGTRANGKVFWGISAKADNLARFAQILDIFSPGISVTLLFDFLEPGIFGLVVRISKISANFGISGNFARKFPYHITNAKMPTFKLFFCSYSKLPH